MKALINLLNNVKRLDESSILITVYDNKGVRDFIIDLNRIGQLFKKGVDANEDIIGRYSVTTESLNSSKKAGTPYTLKDTGDFYATFKIKTNEKGDFVISANTIKEDNDLLDYSKDILGLTKPSLNELIKEILP
ncbi:hypothetical protein DRO61_11575, partial [Candidatus Bathyarchaeota archaeon]